VVRLSRSLLIRWKRLNVDSVDVGSINSIKIMLEKITKNKNGFLWILHRHKDLGLMKLGPRDSTEGELEGELVLFPISC